MLSSGVDADDGRRLCRLPRADVLGREDDPVGNALEYYASRGETPMAWHGAGASWLGLEREVDIAEWRSVFGTGGARHPGAASVSFTACGRAWSSLSALTSRLQSWV